MVVLAGALIFEVEPSLASTRKLSALKEPANRAEASERLGYLGSGISAWLLGSEEPGKQNKGVRNLVLDLA